MDALLFTSLVRSMNKRPKDLKFSPRYETRDFRYHRLDEKKKNKTTKT